MADTTVSQVTDDLQLNFELFPYITSHHVVQIRTEGLSRDARISANLFEMADGVWPILPATQ